LELNVDGKTGMIQKKIKISRKISLQTFKKKTKKFHILNIPWIRILKITHSQGKNLRKKSVKRVTNPLKRIKNHLMILLKTTNT
jgi:hypothetical protein